MANGLPYFINELFSLLDQHLISTYYDFCPLDDEGKKEESLQRFINSIVYEFAETEEAENKKIKSDTKMERRRTKKRWYKILEREFEIEAARDSLLWDDPQERKNEQIAKLNEWLDDSERNITKLPPKFLSTVADAPKTDVNKALYWDFRYVITNLIVSKYGSLKNIIMDSANTLVETIPFSETKKELKLHEIIEPDNNQITLFEDYQTDDYIVRTILKNNNTQISLGKNFTLDEKDYKIITYIASKRDTSFINDATVQVDIGDIVSKFYPSRSKASYNDVRRRIENISSLQFKSIRKKEGQTWDDMDIKTVFSSFQFRTDENGKPYVIITFSPIIQQEYINDQTVRIYANQIDQLETPNSIKLIFSLQKERLEKYTSGEENGDLYPYSFFQKNLRFSSKRVNVNMDKIEKLLTELKQKEVVVKEFFRQKNAFLITFYDLASYEIEDLLPNADPKLNLNVTRAVKRINA